MRTPGWTLFALLLAGVFCLSIAGKYETEEDVLVLTDDNFDEAIKEHEVLLVEFYAPWCGHCKKLTPEYAKAAGILAAHDPPLYIAKVDATIHKKLAETQKIRGFPTLRFFKHGVPSEYQGDRTAESIVDFVVKKSGPPVTTVASVAEAESFFAKNAKAGIAFFSSLESEAAKKFVDFASKFDNYPFAYTADSSVKSKYSAGKQDVLQFKTPEGSFSQPLDWSKTDEEALSTWVFGHAVELLYKYDQNKARELFGGPIKVHVLSFLDEEAKNFAAISSAIKEAAGKTRTQALVVHVPKSEDRILGAFDLKPEDVPKIVIADLRGGAMKRFIFEGDIKAAPLSKFIASFLAGELKPKLKSEEPVAADWEGPVKVVKGSTFKEKVIDSDKDVLLEFYAPWCGHCRQLEPKYEELATKLVDAKGLVIAKMDATANEVDHPAVNVMGYPTILFFKAGAKDSPVSYDKSRDVDSFIVWLKEHVSNPAEITVTAPIQEEGDEEEDDEDDEEEKDEL